MAKASVKINNPMNDFLNDDSIIINEKYTQFFYTNKLAEQEQ